MPRPNSVGLGTGVILDAGRMQQGDGVPALNLRRRNQPHYFREISFSARQFQEMRRMDGCRNNTQPF